MLCCKFDKHAIQELTETLEISMDINLIMGTVFMDAHNDQPETVMARKAM